MTVRGASCVEVKVLEDRVTSSGCREAEGGRLVHCRPADVKAGPREEEGEESSRILRSDGAGEEEAVTSGDLCTFRAPEQPPAGRCHGDVGLLQRH
ncbi:hypothetical protein NQZ68_025415 [Dissostichus eleginoides]|nr:hypothetical protein NQZ68_025415 [Dissostichus eleginoides]